MPIRRSYKIKLFVNILAVFLVTIVIVAAFQYHREKEYRFNLLNNTLSTINKITDQYIRNKKIFLTGNYPLLDSLMMIIPEKGIRVTIIDKEGRVLYDSFVKRYDTLENHLGRPEVQQSLRKEYGTNIRKSASTGRDFYYYAKNYGKYFVRTAILYDLNVVNFLKTDHLFIYFTLLMFVFTFGVLIYLTDRLGDTITKLEKFAVKAGQNDPIDTSITFPKNEFGIIGKQIVQIYESLRKTRDELYSEREKLYRHLQVIDEGVAVFSSSKERILANPHFIQYVSNLSDRTVTEAEFVFALEELREFNEFIDRILLSGKMKEQQKQVVIQKSGRFYQVQCVIFQDRSFEVLINDITKREKNRLIKQQMISNLAHELKTPVTSIMGYLETILTHETIDQEKQRHFIKRAFQQSKRLTSLIRDISMLNKIGEAEDYFKISKINLNKLVKDVVENLQFRLTERHMEVRVHIDRLTVVTGNWELIYSIFQNLLENTILYAGEGVTVDIAMYMEEDEYYYFSYADTGPGIPEEHQARIFERFYRIDKGRSRKRGGTGLGLSIVKNAVIFHRGDISVRNRPGGGVEFLFTLAKTRA